jgi:Na+-driven multidrug efflux pump
MMLDGGVMWCVGIPLAYAAVLLFGVTNVAVLFVICQIEQVIRLFVGMGRYKKGYWLKDLTKETK